jgi:hypothetical protein
VLQLVEYDGICPSNIVHALDGLHVPSVGIPGSPVDDTTHVDQLVCLEVRATDVCLSGSIVTPGQNCACAHSGLGSPTETIGKPSSPRKLSSLDYANAETRILRTNIPIAPGVMVQGRWVAKTPMMRDKSDRDTPGSQSFVSL